MSPAAPKLAQRGGTPFLNFLQNQVNQMSNSLTTSSFPEKGAGATDQRGNLLSVTTTARLLGLGRTQVWRYAKDGTLQAIVLGTALRPHHYFRREDVLALKVARQAERTKAGKQRQRRAQPQLRKLLALMEAGEIDLNSLPPLPSRVV